MDADLKKLSTCGTDHQKRSGFVGLISRVLLTASVFMSGPVFSAEGAASPMAAGPGLDPACNAVEAVQASNIARTRSLREQLRYDEALEVAQEDVKQSRRVGQPTPRLARALNNLASVHRVMGMASQAVPLYLAALKIREEQCGRDHLETAQTLNSLAATYKDLGEYALAEVLFKRALVVREQQLGPAHIDTATALNNLAGVYDALGAHERSEPLYRRALSIFENVRGVQHLETARSLSNLAWSLVAMQNYGDALALYERALLISTSLSGSSSRDSLRVMSNIALLHLKAGRPQLALPLFESVRSSRRNVLGASHPYSIASLVNLAETHLALGDLDRSHRAFLQALASSSVDTPIELGWRIRDGLSRCYARRKKISEAIFFGKQAVNMLQEARGKLQALDQDLQRSFLGGRSSVFRDLASLLISEERIGEGQQVLSMLKEDEFAGFIRGKDPLTGATVIGMNSERERSLASEVDERLRAVAVLARQAEELRKHDQGSVRDVESAARRKEVEDRLEKAALQFVDAVEEIEKRIALIEDKRRFWELRAKSIDRDMSGLVEDLGPGVALLQIILFDDSVHLLVTTANGRVARKKMIDRRVLAEHVTGFLTTLRNPALDPRNSARALYQLLIEPIEPELARANVKTLMISSDGVFRYMPFAALHDGQSYLADRFALSLFTDAARENMKDRPTRNWRIAGLGLSEAREGFSALPAVKEELRSVVFGRSTPASAAGRMHLDGEFNRDMFTSVLLERFQVVHIASHFHFDHEGEDRSFLLMGDGRLSLAEMRKGRSADQRAPLRFAGVELLTLSACQTAVGGDWDEQGREIEGFGVLAQKLGAKGVLATLWPVADDSTRELMEDFYRLRQDKSLSKAEALRQAQNLLRSKSRSGETQAQRGARPEDSRAVGSMGGTRYAHPFYWAPFILMGNWL